MQSLCVAARDGNPQAYPVKTRKLKRSAREHAWLWLAWRDAVWLVKRPDSGVWAGLWSLPEFDSHEDLYRAAQDWPGHFETLPSFTHTLTHLDWTLHPVRWTLPAAADDAQAAACTAPFPEGRWFSLDEALGAGLPAPLRKLLLD